MRVISVKFERSPMRWRLLGTLSYKVAEETGAATPAARAMPMKQILQTVLIAAALSAAALQVAAADPIVLRFAPFASPGQAAYEEFYKPWAEKVTANSHGALTIDLRGGTS